MTIQGALCDEITFARFKKRENHHGGVLLSIKLQAEVVACNFTKINTPP